MLSAITLPEFPNEIISTILNPNWLTLKELDALSLVAKIWKTMVDENTFWIKCMSQFPPNLVEALGGAKKVLKLPYINFTTPRVLASNMFEISEFHAPLTVGYFVSMPLNQKNQSIEPSQLRKYTFLAIRFINREHDENETQKDINVWATEKSFQANTPFFNTSSWQLIAGGSKGSWPTLFLDDYNIGMNFDKTIEYIGRLVRGKPCGVKNATTPNADILRMVYTSSNIETDLLTPTKKISTVSLA